MRSPTVIVFPMSATDVVRKSWNESFVRRPSTASYQVRGSDSSRSGNRKRNWPGTVLRLRTSAATSSPVRSRRNASLLATSTRVPVATSMASPPITCRSIEASRYGNRSKNTFVMPWKSASAYVRFSACTHWRKSATDEARIGLITSVCGLKNSMSYQTVGFESCASGNEYEKRSAAALRSTTVYDSPSTSLMMRAVPASAKASVKRPLTERNAASPDVPSEKARSR